MSYLDLDTATGRPTRKRRYHLLDGVDSQAGLSKPTVRSDGSGLQVGDRWLDTSDRLWWFWNGVYWLSEDQPPAIFGTNALTNLAQYGLMPINPNYNLFLQSYRIAGTTGATNNTSSFWGVSLVRRAATASNTLSSLFTNNSNASETFRLSADLNQHLDVSAISVLSLLVFVQQFGTPSNISGLAVTVTYRLAKP